MLKEIYYKISNIQ